MSSLTNIEKLRFEKLFEMKGGYVLDFSNRTFQEFILSNADINIWDDKYNYGSGSKANRLRAFMQKESDGVVGKLLGELLDYWKTQRQINGVSIQRNEQDLLNECEKVANKLLGKEVETELKGITEDEFINKEFKGLSLDKLELDTVITTVLNQRLDEIKKCLQGKISLAAIFLCGSTLEGILLGIASKNSKDFNESKVSPKNKEGKVLKYEEWSLANFIDVSHSLGLLGEDVKKFSHALRDFRNYIHPYEQVASRFNPDEYTSKICWQVLQAAIFQLSKKEGAHG